MNALAVNYQGGTTLPRDLEQAAYWYCEAVIRGSARAMNNLALLLVSGEIEVDVAEARNLWEQAAEFGNANGMYNLGISYRYGDDANVALADDWMMRGAQAGHEGAQQSVRRNGYNGSLPPPVLPGLEMRPEPKGATGRTKECGLYLS